MSRAYHMQLTIEGFTPDRQGFIEDALYTEWAWGDIRAWIQNETRRLETDGESSLSGGETEEEFALRVTRAVFEANEGPCTITLVAIYMENLPCTTFTYGPEDYEAAIGNAPTPKEGDFNA